MPTRAARGLPRLVGRAALAARRTRRCTPAARSTSPTATARRSTSTASSTPTTTPPTSPTSSPRPAILHIAGVFDAARDGARCPTRWTAMPRYAPDDGRSWWAHTARRRPTGSCACSTSTSSRRRPRRCSPTSACCGWTRLTGDGHRLRQAGREPEPRRGAGQADRRRRGHLRRAVAQGLQPRQPLLPVLLDDRRHLGHRRRRRVGSAPRRRRVAPRVDPAGVRAPRPRPAARRPADEHGRRHRSTSAARCT